MIKPFREVDRKDWFLAGNKNRPDRLAAWHSEDFTVQVFAVAGAFVRLAINRNQQIFSPFLFEDGISRDTLRQIIRAVGYGDWHGIEIYPPQQHVLNIINVRHLWLLPKSPLGMAWSDDVLLERIRTSEDFKVECFTVPGDILKLSVRYKDSKDPRRAINITWDTLQAVKDALWHTERTAFEYYVRLSGIS
jgi:hypothetical protein